MVDPPPEDTDPMEEDPTVEEPAPTAPQVSIDELPSSTYWYTVPVTGRGPENGTLLVDTLSRGAISTDISGSGTFCIDIPLEPGRVNPITFQALDTSGTYSKEVTVEVLQDGEPPTAEQAAPARNMLLGATGFKWALNHDSAAGLYKVTDGSASTWVEVENAWTVQRDWFFIKLPQQSSIERIRVRSGKPDGFCPMKAYTVMFSNKTNPGYAVDDSPDWTNVAVVTNGDGDETFTFAAELARYVGVEFQSDDCHGTFDPANHIIREVEAWEPAPPPPPEPEAPSCGVF